MILLSGILALCLALVHLFASKVRFLHGIPRSRWLSMAGGASVAYVFVHLLPELSEWQHIYEESGVPFLDFLSHHLYIIALLGLATFYGIERAAKLSGESEREEEGEQDQLKNVKVYDLHIGSFALYNALIGYLLIHRDQDGTWPLIFFTTAMALHFLVNDYALLDHYRKKYLQQGRWIMAGAIGAGWIIGALTAISDLGVSILFAFVAGGIMLNVLKEELPEERKSRFWAFMLGVIIYGGFLSIL